MPEHDPDYEACCFIEIRVLVGAEAYDAVCKSIRDKRLVGALVDAVRSVEVGNMLHTSATCMAGKHLTSFQASIEDFTSKMGGDRQSCSYQTDHVRLQSAGRGMYKALREVVSLPLRKGFAPSDFGSIPRWDIKFRLPRRGKLCIWVVLGSSSEQMGPMGTGDDVWEDRRDLSVIPVKGPNAMGAPAVVTHAISNAEKNQRRVDDATIYYRRVMDVAIEEFYSTATDQETLVKESAAAARKLAETFTEESARVLRPDFLPSFTSRCAADVFDYAAQAVMALKGQLGNEAFKKLLPTYEELKESLRSGNPPALHLVLWSLVRGCNATREVSKKMSNARGNLYSVKAFEGQPEIHGNERIKALCGYGSDLQAAQVKFEGLLGVLGLPTDLDGAALDELLKLAPVAVKKNVKAHAEFCRDLMVMTTAGKVAQELFDRDALLPDHGGRDGGAL